MDYRTADLMDLHGDALQVCEAPLRTYGGRRHFHGRIRTVRCREDNFLVRKVLSEPGLGGVLVVDGDGSLHAALIGDVIAGLARDHGWAGVVVWGAVRDVEALALLDIGIKAAGSNPRKSAKTGAGAVDIPVGFGGVVFQPGTWIYCDEDGIVVAPDRLIPEP